jgi:hypothetical protein
MEYKTKQAVEDFLAGIITQQKNGREWPESLFKQAVDTMYNMYDRADTMSKDDADAYITTCLGVYLLETFYNSDNVITDIKPGD